MNIILVSPYVPPSARGDAFAAERLKEGLMARGHDVRLFNGRRPFVQEVLATPADVLHSINAFLCNDWVDQYLRVRKIPWVITLTGTDYDLAEDSLPREVRKSLTEADCLVVSNEKILQQLSKVDGNFKEKTRVLSPGVEATVDIGDREEFRRECGLSGNQVFFLLASAIRPVKDVGLALSACKSLHSENMVFGLVGPGIDPVETATVLSNGVPIHCFRYFGPKLRKDTRRYMSAADVFINTSKRDELSCAMLEAMAESCAVIATATPMNEAIIRDGQNGLLIPPGDSEALATACALLHKDEYLRNRLSKAAKETIESHFSPTTELSGYEEIYREIKRGRTSAV